VISKERGDHIRHLKQVLERYKKYGFVARNDQLGAVPVPET
jgi:hypothetical protein